MTTVIADKLALLENLAPMWDTHGVLGFGLLDLEELRAALETQRQELTRLQRAIRRLDEGLSGPPGKRLSLETVARRLEQLAERG